MSQTNATYYSILTCKVKSFSNFTYGTQYVSPKVLPFSNSETKLPKATSKAETQDKRIARPDENTTIALQSYHFGDFDQLDQLVKSMMEKGQNKHANGIHTLHKCKVCGKEGMNHAIKDHIEANHIEGIVIPCNLCEKTFRSRNALRSHNRSYHTRLQ